MHYSEICQIKYCENVKSCNKRHPRSCYYFCAYRFCKFGKHCQFRHENPPLRNNGNKDSNVIEENRALKIQIDEMNEKHETLKVQLDSFMETQAKQENCNREIVVKDIDKFQQDFAHIIDDKNKII